MEKAFLRRGQAFPEPSTTEKVQTIYKLLLTVTKDRNVYVHIKRPFIECLSIFPALPSWRLSCHTMLFPFLFVFMHDKSASNMYAYLFIYIYMYTTNISYNVYIYGTSRFHVFHSKAGCFSGLVCHRQAIWLKISSKLPSFHSSLSTSSRAMH